MQSLVELEKEVRDVLDVLGLLSSSTYTEVASDIFLNKLQKWSLCFLVFIMFS